MTIFDSLLISVREIHVPASWCCFACSSFASWCHPGDGRLGRRVGVSGGSVVSVLRAGLGGWVGGRDGGGAFWECLDWCWGVLVSMFSCLRSQNDDHVF